MTASSSTTLLSTKATPTTTAASSTTAISTARTLPPQQITPYPSIMMDIPAVKNQGVENELHDDAHLLFSSITSLQKQGKHVCLGDKELSSNHGANSADEECSEGDDEDMQDALNKHSDNGIIDDGNEEIGEQEHEDNKGMKKEQGIKGRKAKTSPKEKPTRASLWKQASSKRNSSSSATSSSLKTYACENCRIKHTRCTGDQTPCQRCKKYGLECVRLSDMRRRGRTLNSSSPNSSSSPGSDKSASGKKRKSSSSEKDIVTEMPSTPATRKAKPQPSTSTSQNSTETSTSTSPGNGESGIEHRTKRMRKARTVSHHPKASLNEEYVDMPTLRHNLGHGTGKRKEKKKKQDSSDSTSVAEQKTISNSKDVHVNEMKNGTENVDDHNAYDENAPHEDPQYNSNHSYPTVPTQKNEVVEHIGDDLESQVKQIPMNFGLSKGGDERDGPSSQRPTCIFITVKKQEQILTKGYKIPVKLYSADRDHIEKSLRMSIQEALDLSHDFILEKIFYELQLPNQNKEYVRLIKDNIHQFPEFFNTGSMFTIEISETSG